MGYNHVIDLIGKIQHLRGKNAEMTTRLALAEMIDSAEIVSFYKTARRADKF